MALRWDVVITGAIIIILASILGGFLLPSIIVTIVAPLVGGLYVGFNLKKGEVVNALMAGGVAYIFILLIAFMFIMLAIYGNASITVVNEGIVAVFLEFISELIFICGFASVGAILAMIWKRNM